MKRKKRRRLPKRFLGTYTLPNGSRVVGEIQLNGGKHAQRMGALRDNRVGGD